MNTTQKPVAAARWIIDHFCPENAGVIDVTTGTGTTAVAAMLTGRAFLGFDMCPDGVEGSKQRILTVSADLQALMIHANIISANDKARAEAVAALQSIIADEEDDKAALIEKLLVQVKAKVEKFKSIQVGEWASWGDELLGFYMEAWKLYATAQKATWVKRTLEKPQPEFDAWLMSKWASIRSIVNAARDATNRGVLLDQQYVVTGASWELYEDGPPTTGTSLQIVT